MMSSSNRYLAGGSSGRKRKSKTPSFTAINASDTPTKRQRTSATSSKMTDTGDQDDDDEVSEDNVRSFQRTLFGAKKDTRIRSSSRAVVNESDVRQEPCLRCAGEVQEFPDLQCSNNPSSSAAKCLDCCKKGKPCELVSQNFFCSLARHGLTTGEVPARLKSLLDDLLKAASQFNSGKIKQADLSAAQFIFNQEKRRVNHSTKVSDAEAQKSPWKPVVSSTEELCTSVVSAINGLRGALISTLSQEFEDLKESNAELTAEISGLREVSKPDIRQ